MGCVRFGKLRSVSRFVLEQRAGESLREFRKRHVRTDFADKVGIASGFRIECARDAGDAGEIVDGRVHVDSFDFAKTRFENDRKALFKVLEPFEHRVR